MKKILPILILLVCANIIFSQTLLHPWSTIDAGGITDTSSGLSVHGTSGDPTLATDTSGTISFSSGYLPGERFITSTFVVTDTNNSGPGSLKQAILDANAQPGLDYITFNIAPGGHQVIHPDSVLPEISDPVILDATTQPGFAGTPIIEIDATNAGVRAFSCGIFSIATSGATIRGLVVNNAVQTDAICINGYGVYQNWYNVIEGCYLGTDVTGMQARPNAGNGVFIQNSSYNRIGGTTPAQRNVLSGNVTLGIRLLYNGTNNNLIEGNYIGVNATGDSALPNQLGGFAGQFDSNTVIGGTATGARNVISGNGNYGIAFDGGDSATIQGNYIGTDATGIRAIANGGVGVSVVVTPKTHIGGSAPGAGNLISGNGGAGVQIIQARNMTVEGNYIGTNAAGDTTIGNALSGIFNNSFFDTTNLVVKNNVICGNGGDGIHVANTNVPGNIIIGNHVGTDVTGEHRLGNLGNGIVTNFASFYKIGGVPLGEANTIAYNVQHGVLVSNTGVDTSNTVSGNSIYGNGFLGIKLGGLEYEPAQNDSLDPDSGPNNNQNYPVLTYAEGDSFNVHVLGMLNSHPNEVFTLEFFSNDSADASGYGEGKEYIGSIIVTTNGAGNVMFSYNGDYSKSPGSVITATATDSLGNTSEFSQTVSVTQAQPTLTVKDVNVLEGNSGSMLADFSINLEPVSEDTVLVQFMTVDGTATVASGDYNDTTGTLIFAPGEYQKIVSVSIYADTLSETNEEFFLRLHNVTNATIGDSLAFCLITDDDSTQSFRYSVNRGWNLISLPISVPDRNKTVLYPTAISNAFAFTASGGYGVRDSINYGTGYWLKYPENDIITLQGTGLQTLTIPVSAGWNIVGSLSSPFAVANITSNPAGIVTSQFFTYKNGYLVSDTVNPSKGYWVKVSESGTLTLQNTTSRSLAKHYIRIIPTSELPPKPPTGEVNSNNTIIPNEYALAQNYPNPFNPNTVISYSLPVDGFVTLTVFNVGGQEVVTLLDNQTREAGMYELNFDASKFASGVYYYRLTATGVVDNAKTFTDIKKMLLVK